MAIAGIVASILFGLKAFGIALIGTIPQGFPPLTLPQFSLVSSLWINALGIALIIFTETIAAGRAFMRRTDPPIIPNQELLALGVSNGLGSLFSTMPAGGGTSQTAVNRNAGGKTEVSAFVTALTVLLVVLILAPVISQMPSATLGAIIIFSMVGMLNVAEFKAIYRVRRVEFWWALAALLGAVTIGTLEGILIAVILSLISLIHFASTPKVYEVGRIPGTHVFRPLSPDHPDDELFPGLLIIRPEGAMDFLNVSHIRDRVWDMVHRRQPQVIIIDGSAIPNIESTALKGLANFDQTLRDQNITLWMARLNPEALRMVRRSPIGTALEPDRLFYKVEEAVNRYLQENPNDRR